MPVEARRAIADKHGGEAGENQNFVPMDMAAALLEQMPEIGKGRGCGESEGSESGKAAGHESTSGWIERQSSHPKNLKAGIRP